MAVAIQFSTSGATIADALIDGLGHNLGPAMQSCSEAIKEFVDRRWDLQQDPWGRPWRPLSPRYLAYRIRLASGQARRQRLPARAVGAGGITILLFAGDLRRGWVPRFGPTWASIESTGPATKYARRHQFGGEGPPGVFIAARPMIPVRPGGSIDTPQELQDEITATIRDAIGQGLTGGTL